GARLVLTAGHCLFDHRLGRWVNPEHVHFVAGQARDNSSGHAKAQSFIIPPQLDMADGSDGARHSMRPDPFAHDWALIRPEVALDIKPVPVKAIAASAIAEELASGEIARAGYSADRRYLLSVHRGCAAALGEPGTMLNRCDARPGDSGSPLLLLRGEETVLIGLSTGAAHLKQPDQGYVAVAGRPSPSSLPWRRSWRLEGTWWPRAGTAWERASLLRHPHHVEGMPARGVLGLVDHHRGACKGRQAQRAEGIDLATIVELDV